MARNNYRLINLHSAEVKQPVKALELGEIAVQHSAAEGSQRIYIETASGDARNTATLIEFVPKAYIDGLNTSMNTRVGALETTVGNAESGLVKKVADLEVAVGEGGSVGTQITAAIEKLDATVGVAEVAEGKHVAVQVVETDGVITAVNVAESDIASAAGLKNVVDSLAETGTVGAKIKANADAIATLNGAADAAGSVAKAVADAKSAIEGTLAETDAKTLAALNDRIDTLSSEAKTYEMKKLSDSEVSALGNANVREAYKLVDEEKAQVGDTILIYKDSALKEVKLDGQTLNFTYILANGTEDTVGVDISAFLAESEFGNGLQVVDHVVSVKLANGSESFLTVDENGVKLSGVQTAIDNAVAGKNVSAEGDDYVSATAADNKVTVAATAKTTASLALADSALQKDDIATGSANGTIAVKGTDVAVHGLGSAAYTEASAYATAAQGELANSAVQKVTILGEELTNGGELTVAEAKTALGLKSAAYTEASDYATAAQGTKADNALQSSDIQEGSTNGTIAVKGTDVAVHGLGSAAYTDANAYATAAQGTKADSAINLVDVNTLDGGDKLASLTIEKQGDSTDMMAVLTFNVADTERPDGGIVTGDALEYKLNNLVIDCGTY